MSKSLKISVSEFKAKSLGLFEQVAKSGIEIVVTKHGQPIAVVMPFKEPPRNRQGGKLRGSLVACGDIITPVATDEWEAAK